MREKKYQEIVKFCEDNFVNYVTIRNVASGGKTRIKVTAFCRECNSRFDVSADTLRRQKYAGLCTSCAHRHCSEERKFCAQDVVERFEQYGYTVLTPLDKIKPVGKNQSYNRSVVEIQDKYGVIYKTCWNSFWNNRDKFIALNEGGYSAVGKREPSCLERATAEYLDRLGVRYKREFKFSDCRGDHRPLPFDFCINYDGQNRLLIEVDGERHYKEMFSELQRYDRIKDYYCAHHNIPLLRIPYWEFNDSEKYKQSIQSFIGTNGGSDTI